MGDASSEVRRLADYDSILLRGEGCRNLVVSALKIGLNHRVVWRFWKDPDPEGGVLDITDRAKKQCLQEMDYLTNTIAKLIEQQYLVTPTLIHFDKEELLNLYKKLKNSHCPLHVGPRCPCRDRFDVSFDSTAVTWSFVTALEMPDLTRTPPCNRVEVNDLLGTAPVITVEIKPKQGFVLKDKTVTTVGERSYCQNCILQYEKVSAGKFDQIYDYCPLDLFSGDQKRMKTAVMALIQRPHNNFKVFCNGDLIHCDKQILPQEDWAKQLQLSKNGHNTTESFAEVIASILRGQQSDEKQVKNDANNNKTPRIRQELGGNSVLARLLCFQQMDKIGLEQAADIYEVLPEARRKALSDARSLELRAQAKAECQQCQLDKETLLLDYLIAASAKDCSLMLTLQAISQPRSGNKHDFKIFYSSKLSQWFAFRISVIDLDTKPAQKLASTRRRYERGVALIREEKPVRPCLVSFV